MDVVYRFEGVEPPVRVNLYLIDAADAPDCDSVGTQPRALATAEHRSLPVVWPLESEGVVFDDLPADSEWVVTGVGMTDAAEVAFGCVDGVQITDGTVTYTDMVLRNEPMPMEGTYTGAIEVDLGLTEGGTITEAGYDLLNEAVCSLLDTCDEPDEETRAIVSELLVELADLEVLSVWTIHQNGDLINGEVEWTHIEGIEVGPEWQIVSGIFQGEIPGTTQVLLSSNDLAIDTEELARFVLAEVMEEDVSEFPPELEEVLPTLQLTDGLAAGLDLDFDRRADRVQGTFFTTVGPGGVDIVYGVPLPWTIHRVEDAGTEEE